MRNNEAIFDGGALFITTSEDIKFSDLVIINNIANENGGGVFISRSS